MSDEENFRELQEVVRRQFEVALAGGRPVHCAVCGRPHRPCRGIEVTAPSSRYRVVWPYRHAVGRGNRNLCLGSEMQALLTPRQ